MAPQAKGRTTATISMDSKIDDPVKWHEWVHDYDDPPPALDAAGGEEG